MVWCLCLRHGMPNSIRYNYHSLGKVIDGDLYLHLTLTLEL
jgi:hypothetical protein